MARYGPTSPLVPPLRIRSIRSQHGTRQQRGRAGSANQPARAAANLSTPPPQTVHKSYTPDDHDPNILWGSYSPNHQMLWFWG